MPADYTSGFFLLFGTALTHAITFVLGFDWTSGGAVVLSYALFVSTFFLTTTAMLVSFSRLNLLNSPILILSNCLAVLFLIPFAADRIVGEFLSSLLLVSAATTLFFQNRRQPSTLLLILVSTVLGFAVETKMSSVFTATFLQGLVYLTAIRTQHRWITISACSIAAILPKLASMIIIWTYLDYNSELLRNFVEGLSNVAKYNSGAGLNWSADRFEPRLQMLSQHSFVASFSILAVFLATVHLLLCLAVRRPVYAKESFILAAFMAVSLLFPLIYKFPYPRVLSQFVGLLPLFVIFGVNLFFSNKLRDRATAFTAVLMFIVACQTPPVNRALFSSKTAYEMMSTDHLGDEAIYEKLLKSNQLILVDGFFGTPWDLLYQIDNYQKYDIRFHSIHAPAPNSNKIVFLSSCRYGWCSKEKSRKIQLNSLPPLTLNCVVTESSEHYQIRDCAALAEAS